MFAVFFGYFYVLPEMKTCCKCQCLWVDSSHGVQNNLIDYCCVYYTDQSSISHIVLVKEVFNLIIVCMIAHKKQTKRKEQDGEEEGTQP